MNEKNDKATRESRANFMLWRILDHTRFMVARSREKELAQYGVTQEQAHVLDILTAKGDTITINEIVMITQRQHHSISTLITRMSRQGLLKKVKDKQDSRKWDVSITPKGRKLYRQLKRETIDNIFSCLSPEEQLKLNHGLRLVLNKAYEVLGQPMENNVYRHEDTDLGFDD